MSNDDNKKQLELVTSMLQQVRSLESALDAHVATQGPPDVVLGTDSCLNGLFARIGELAEDLAQEGFSLGKFTRLRTVTLAAALMEQNWKRLSKLLDHLDSVAQTPTRRMLLEAEVNRFLLLMLAVAETMIDDTVAKSKEFEKQVNSVHATVQTPSRTQPGGQG